MNTTTTEKRILEHKATRVVREGGRKYRAVVTIAYVHLQGNEKPYFSVTGEKWLYLRGQEYRGFHGEDRVKLSGGGSLGLESCGCLHDDIRKHFHELARFVRFHLWDGLPIHYVANAVYWWEYLVGKSQWGDCRKALNNDFDYTDPLHPRKLTDLECRRKVRSILFDHIGYGLSSKDIPRRALTRDRKAFIEWLNERAADIQTAFEKALEDLKALTEAKE